MLSGRPPIDCISAACETRCPVPVACICGVSVGGTGVDVAGVEAVSREAGLEIVAAFDEVGLDIAPAADPIDRSISNGVVVATTWRSVTRFGGKLLRIDPLMLFGVEVRGGDRSSALQTSTHSGAVAIATRRRAISRRRFRLDRCFTRILYAHLCPMAHPSVAPAPD